ncbi:unnamed protein product [Fraxinus pennsylvanica]|uniref:Uncharacterized protein n=1 Tax=Fraxinus pennsylvanica TaxID=56036 RepID=A0AAD2A038_9LAMI|nr:unnamed protein product [Fraxinus pennsylvanica]
MPRVPKLQDEEDNDWIEKGSEDTVGSLSANDNDGLDCRKRGPKHGINVCADESGRIPLTVGGIMKYTLVYHVHLLVNGTRFITISASHAVSATLKAYLGGPYPMFSLVPVDTKKFLWERFQQKYSWPKIKDNEHVGASPHSLGRGKSIVLDAPKSLFVVATFFPCTDRF